VGLDSPKEVLAMMKRLLVLLCLTIALLAFPRRSDAQAFWGAIDITSDEAGTNCLLPTSGPITMYVIARPDMSVGTGAGFFAVEFGMDLSQFYAGGASYTGESSQGSIINGSIVPGPGVQVGFAACQTSDTHVYTVLLSWNLEPSGTFYVSITGSTLPTNDVAMAECTATREVRSVLAGQALASTVPGCDCTAHEGDCPPTAVERGTWGAVKALYRD
jgi:hypothetical protein